MPVEREKNLSEALSAFPKLFVTVRPGRRTRRHLVGSAPSLQMP